MRWQIIVLRVGLLFYLLLFGLLSACTSQATPGAQETPSATPTSAATSQPAGEDATPSPGGAGAEPTATATSLTPSLTATSPSATEEETPSPEGAVTDTVSLVEELGAQGAQVQPAGSLEQPFFLVEAQLLDVGDQQLQLFEFADAISASASAATVSTSGDSVGTTMMTWIEPPHFYQAGQLIVLYVGSDTATLELLEEVLGPPFAGR
ncbi:MAG: hypothetical protein H0T73_12810 [Ardenticatenales bacterium]|nr:hypothetical protein [Ardenticatenales bacterium]